MNAHEKYVYQHLDFGWECLEGCGVDINGGYAPYTAVFSATDLQSHIVPGAYQWDFDGGRAADGTIPDWKGDTASGPGPIERRFEADGTRQIFIRALPLETDSWSVPKAKIIVLQEAPLGGALYEPTIRPKGQGNDVCDITLYIREDEGNPGFVRIYGDVKWKADAVQVQVGPVFFTQGVRRPNEAFWRRDPTTNPGGFRAGTVTRLPPYTLETANSHSITLLVEGAQCFEAQNLNPVQVDFGYPAAIVVASSN